MTRIEPMRESPKTLTCCPWCGDGIFRKDVLVSRCSNCGAEESYDDVPVILGGQGNTPESVIKTGTSYGIIVLVSFMSLVVGMILGSMLS